MSRSDADRPGVLVHLPNGRLWHPLPLPQMLAGGGELSPEAWAGLVAPGARWELAPAPTAKRATHGDGKGATVVPQPPTGDTHDRQPPGDPDVSSPDDVPPEDD
jgi:hypothetical protein